MSDRLKQEYLDWAQLSPNGQYIEDRNSYGLGYAVLAAAARGEIPGFQLVPVEPTEKMCHAGDMSGAYDCTGAWILHADSVYREMLTASREEQK